MSPPEVDDEGTWEAVPRRSATSPPHPDDVEGSTKTDLPGGSGSSEWLSVVMAPLVVGLSIVLALATSHLTGASDDGTSAPTAQAAVTDSAATATPTEPGQPIQLDDASFTAPASWTVASEDVIDDSRLAVRLVEPESDTRLQAVTLGPQDQDLEATCRALMDLQEEAYESVTTHLTLPIDNGVTCGFEGLRTEDNRANTVSFTMLQRPEDQHLLLLRTTVPDDVEQDSRAHAQLVAMQCEVSRNFGAPKPLC